MAGTKLGAAKAAKTNKLKDPNFYAKIGSKSWDGERSHKVGFALLDEETHKAVSKKGGSKTKEEYHIGFDLAEKGKDSTAIYIHKGPGFSSGISE